MCKVKVTNFLYPDAPPPTPSSSSSSSSSSGTDLGIVARDFGMERARSSSSSSSSSGVLRWVVTLVLEDDTAEVEAMLVPKAAEALLGTPSTAPAAVNKAKLDINACEAPAHIYADDVAAREAMRLHQQQHYLCSFGDSAVVFHHVANTEKATADALRWLQKYRADHEAGQPRQWLSHHLTREWNKPSDRAAAGDMAAFFLEAQWLLGSDVSFVETPVHDAPFADLVAFMCR